MLPRDLIYSWLVSRKRLAARYSHSPLFATIGFLTIPGQDERSQFATWRKRLRDAIDFALAPRRDSGCGPRILAGGASRCSAKSSIERVRAGDANGSPQAASNARGGDPLSRYIGGSGAAAPPVSPSSTLQTHSSAPLGVLCQWQASRFLLGRREAPTRRGKPLSLAGQGANPASCVRPKWPKCASFANIAHLHSRGQRSDGERTTTAAKAGGLFPRGRSRRDQFHVVAMISSRVLRSDDHRRWYCPWFLPLRAAGCDFETLEISAPVVRGSFWVSQIAMPFALCKGECQQYHTSVPHDVHVPALQAARHSKVTTVTAEIGQTRSSALVEPHASRHLAGRHSPQRSSSLILGSMLFDVTSLPVFRKNCVWADRDGAHRPRPSMVGWCPGSGRECFAQACWLGSTATNVSSAFGPRPPRPSRTAPASRRWCRARPYRGTC